MDNPLEGSVVTKKLGPLPLWVWAAAGVVIFVLASRFISFGGSASVDQDTGDSYDEDVDTTSGVGDISSTGVPGAGTVTPSTGDGDYGPSTITEWAQRAINYLVSKGYTGTLASQAIAAFVNTGTVTQAQRVLLDIAIAGIGAPPDGAYNITVTNPPSSTPTTKPKPSSSKPGKPTGVKVSSVTAKSATVSWTKVPGATGYTVRVSGAKVAKDNRTMKVVGTSVSIGGMTSGEKFKVHVTATNGAGQSAESVVQVNLKGKVG